MIHFNYNRLCGVCLLFLLMSTISADLLGQRNRNERRGQNEDEDYAESDRRASEFYFIEGEKYYLLEDYAKSLVAFQKSIEITPHNAAAYYKLAQIMAKNEQLPEAEANILKAIELEPSNKYYYLEASDIYSALGDFASASEWLEKMVAKIPKTEQYYLELAGLYLFQDELDKAYQTFDKAEQRYGVVEEISQQKQQILLRQNKIEEAISISQDLVAAFPGTERFVIGMAEIMYANGKKEEAIAALIQHLEAYGGRSSSGIMVLLSEYYRQEGDLKESTRYLESAFNDPQLSIEHKIQVLINYISQFPDEFYVDAAKKLGRILIEAHPESSDVYVVNADMYTELVNQTNPGGETRKELFQFAASYYDQSLKLDPSKFSVWQNLLNIELQLHRWESLASHAEEAMILFPNQPLVYLFAGIGYFQSKQYDEAIGFLEQGKRITTANVQLKSSFLSRLGDTYNATGDFELSDQNYEEALKLTPEDDIVLNNWSYYLAQRNDRLDLARNMSREVIRRNPDNTTYLDTHGWVVFKLKDYEAARRIFERILELDHDNAVYFDHYGDVLYMLGDVEGAVENWKTALRLNAQNENLARKINNRKIIE